MSIYHKETKYCVTLAKAILRRDDYEHNGTQIPNLKDEKYTLGKFT